jgi:hypothetical protein
MPRPKPKKGSPTWYSRGHPLSENAKTELLERLGLDSKIPDDANKGAKALRVVEYWLGFYPGGVDALDNAPRSADYRQTLTPIRKRAYKLCNDLCELNQWMCEAVEIRDVDVNALKLSLIALVDAIGKAVSEMGNTESRGRPKDQALRQVVGELRRIFMRYHRGANLQRSIKGAVTPLSERENEEVEFVEIALDEANIDHPQNLRSLFDEPGAALPHERNKVIKKLVRDHQQRTARKKKPTRKSKSRSRR